MSAWHRPDVETAALDYLSRVLPEASAQQIVAGLLARGRDQRAAEVRALAEQVEDLERVRSDRDAFADRVDTLTAVAKSNKRAYTEAVAAVTRLEQQRVELERIANAERERVAELEQQAAELSSLRNALALIAKFGDMSETARREIRDLLDGA